MIESVRVVITHPTARLETRTGILYGPELEALMRECHEAGLRAVAYAHNHAARHVRLVVGQSDPPRGHWARKTAPLSDVGPRASYGPTHD